MKKEDSISPQNKFPEIDGLEVIENYMLYKGENVAHEHGGKMQITFKPLVDMAIVHYNLKSNATNKLRVKFDLEKYFMRRNMMRQQTVVFPKSLYVKVAEINQQYRNEHNSELE